MTTVRDVLFVGDTDPKSRIGVSLTGVDGPGAFIKFAPMDDLVEVLWDLLDLPLQDVIFKAWDEYRRVEDAKKRTTGSPRSVERVRVAKHTISGRYHPKIELRASAVTLPALTFDLDLVLELAGAVISVAGGRVASVAPGSAAATATLATAGKTIAETRQIEVMMPTLIQSPSG